MPNFSKSANDDIEKRIQDLEQYAEENTASLFKMMELLKFMGEATHELDKRLTDFEDYLNLNEPTS